MNIDLGAVIIDAAEPDPESAFWHRLLGGSIAKTETHHFLRIDGFPVLVIQRAEGHVPPKWPDGDSQQMHIDLTTDDLAAADRRALDAGARRLNPTDDVDPAAQSGGRVYASPAGHPFCLRSA
ncbi:VOC family protein [Streptomyces samsunensis]|uniref:VOC family protein n=1 Tax=Streptomyces malaysiensis TaxID=92644 RepID=UPI001581869A|nr:VOC family protein [Streptomyces samsunensis]MCC4316079.1 VOC family protein [Streptomyces malaysiensis]NUH35792.1 VOC family protein [Streptomyces samsunensis]